MAQPGTGRAGRTGRAAARILRAEISAQEGHFLVFGLPSLGEVWPGIALDELLEIVQLHEAAIVAAHPFRWNQPFDEIVAQHGPVFDALELVSNNVTRDTRKKTEALLRRHAMGSTGSSDAHELGVVGCYYTEFDRPIRSLEDFVAGIKSRQGAPATEGRFPLQWAGRSAPRSRADIPGAVNLGEPGPLGSVYAMNLLDHLGQVILELPQLLARQRPRLCRSQHASCLPYPSLCGAIEIGVQKREECAYLLDISVSAGQPVRQIETSRDPFQLGNAVCRLRFPASRSLQAIGNDLSRARE